MILLREQNPQIYALKYDQWLVHPGIMADFRFLHVFVRVATLLFYTEYL